MIEYYDVTKILDPQAKISHGCHEVIIIEKDNRFTSNEYSGKAGKLKMCVLKKFGKWL